MVEGISILHTAQPMYNLTVDTAHTFFVGGVAALVHNACRGVVDTNLLSSAHSGNKNTMDFLNDNRGTLGVTPTVRQEFLASPGRTEADFDAIVKQYDLQVLAVDVNDVNIRANNIVHSVQRAPQLPSSPTPRRIHSGDANVLPEAEHLNLTLYTADQRFYRRGRDLGAFIQYVSFDGPLSAAAKGAQNYVPQPIPRVPLTP